MDPSVSGTVSGSVRLPKCERDCERSLSSGFGTEGVRAGPATANPAACMPRCN